MDQYKVAALGKGQEEPKHSHDSMILLRLRYDDIDKRHGLVGDVHALVFREIMFRVTSLNHDSVAGRPSRRDIIVGLKVASDIMSESLIMMEVTVFCIQVYKLECEGSHQPPLVLSDHSAACP